MLCMSNMKPTSLVVVLAPRTDKKLEFRIYTDEKLAFLKGAWHKELILTAISFF